MKRKAVFIINLKSGTSDKAAIPDIIADTIDHENFDYEIGEICKNKKVRFTRYADDMTFSGDFDETEVIRIVKKSLSKLHLNLNRDKTRTRKQGQQQEVTGIVVNCKPQIAKKTRKDIRKNMYYITKYGLESHLNHIGEERKHYIEHLFGQVNYALFINPQDNEMMRYKMMLKDIMKIRNAF